MYHNHSKYLVVRCVVLKVFIMSKVQSLTHPTPKLFCYKFWAMSQANGSSYWAGLTGWPTRRPWVKKPTHSLFHWATGLPTGFNITGLGCPLAWWTSGLLGQPMGHGLFDDPYMLPRPPTLLLQLWFVPFMPLRKIVP